MRYIFLFQYIYKCSYIFNMHTNIDQSESSVGITVEHYLMTRAQNKLLMVIRPTK